VASRLLDLDRAATTPVAEEVLAAMLPVFRDVAGNPSSIHAAGRQARRLLEEARERVAAAAGTPPGGVVFTSGATEAIHLAVLGVMASRPNAHLITSALEHAATLSACRAAERAGARLTLIAPDERGVVTPDAVISALRDDTALVALMRVNNETGVLTDVAAVGQRLREHGARLLVDSVQGFGYEPTNLAALGADLLALSAHKVEGPKGIGALVLRTGVTIEPLVGGGSQERGLRAGTSPVPLAVGFGVAAERAAAGWRERSERVAALRDRLDQGLRAAVPGLVVHGSDAPRGPKHLHVRVPGDVDGEVLLINLDSEGVLASAGSACAAGSLEPSHVLLAMGLSRAEARASVRFSLGDHLAEGDVDDAVRRIARAVERTIAVV
jgi:cysteine desulfurase